MKIIPILLVDYHPFNDKNCKISVWFLTFPSLPWEIIFIFPPWLDKMNICQYAPLGLIIPEKSIYYDWSDIPDWLDLLAQGHHYPRLCPGLLSWSLMLIFVVSVLATALVEVQWREGPEGLQDQEEVVQSVAVSWPPAPPWLLTPGQLSTSRPALPSLPALLPTYFLPRLW